MLRETPTPQITEGFRTGAGVGWHEHGAGLFEGTERFFRSGYRANVVPVWIPALEGSKPSCTPGCRSPTSARLEEVIRAAGFTRVRQAAETLFNIVLEARP
ncbi:MAG TPA: hypothetical protein VNA67_05445 [Pseudonocardiaceae bacterium]|nr:hypothetical protein [Pseudonocardiaceae bacterium]